MANFLRYLTELTVNGQPVEEDEDEDYSGDEDTGDDEKEEETGGAEETPPAENDDTGVDLSVADAKEKDEPDVDDDYSVDDPEDDEEDENPVPINNPDEEKAADTDGGDTTEPSPDTGDDGGVDLNVDTGGDDNADDDYTADDDTTDNGGSEDIPSDGDSGNNADDDYTTDDSGDESTEEDTGEDVDNTDDTSYDSTDDVNDGDSGSLEDKIRSTEAEIFNSLSDDEKVTKNRELMDDYITLKTTIKVFLEKVRTITITDENRSVLNFVESNLIDLNKIITDYIIERFNSKSYMENFIFYQQLILTISQLKEIIKKLKPEENPKK